MMKILVIHYSQSGQLTQILKNFINPLEKENEIDFVKYDLTNKFPFPWTSKVFFDSMPESVLEIPKEVENISYKYTKYDLIILGYQPWFLSPSIPTVSLLKNEQFKNLLKETKVVSIIGSRNMWINGQESVKKYLKEANAELIGNIPLFDRHNNYASAVSILYWMLTGKKEKFLGIFPKPGVAGNEIESMGEFGEILNSSILNNNLNTLQSKFLATGRIVISNSILFVELRGKKLFKIWANLIQNKVKNRKLWITIYKYYLLVALFIVAPIVLIILNIFIFPFAQTYFKKKKSYFCSTELK
ncbi:MAG: hypothetical protein ACPGVH_07685 [Chitinophagales bacterium]